MFRTSSKLSRPSLRSSRYPEAEDVEYSARCILLRMFQVQKVINIRHNRAVRNQTWKVTSVSECHARHLGRRASVSYRSGKLGCFNRLSTDFCSPDHGSVRCIGRFHFAARAPPKAACSFLRLVFPQLTRTPFLRRFQGPVSRTLARSRIFPVLIRKFPLVASKHWSRQASVAVSKRWRGTSRI